MIRMQNYPPPLPSWPPSSVYTTTTYNSLLSSKRKNENEDDFLREIFRRHFDTVFQKIHAEREETDAAIADAILNTRRQDTGDDELQLQPVRESSSFGDGDRRASLITPFDESSYLQELQRRKHMVMRKERETEELFQRYALKNIGRQGERSNGDRSVMVTSNPHPYEKTSYSHNEDNDDDDNDYNDVKSEKSFTLIIINNGNNGGASIVGAAESRLTEFIREEMQDILKIPQPINGRDRIESSCSLFGEVVVDTGINNLLGKMENSDDKNDYLAADRLLATATRDQIESSSSLFGNDIDNMVVDNLFEEFDKDDDYDNEDNYILSDVTHSNVGLFGKVSKIIRIMEPPTILRKQSQDLPFQELEMQYNSWLRAPSLLESECDTAEEELHYFSEKWTAYWSSNYERVYYHNSTTDHTCWTKPRDVEIDTIPVVNLEVEGSNRYKDTNIVHTRRCDLKEDVEETQPHQRHPLVHNNYAETINGTGSDESEYSANEVVITVQAKDMLWRRKKALIKKRGRVRRLRIVTLFCGTFILVNCIYTLMEQVVTIPMLDTLMASFQKITSIHRNMDAENNSHVATNLQALLSQSPPSYYYSLYYNAIYPSVVATEKEKMEKKRLRSHLIIETTIQSLSPLLSTLTSDAFFPLALYERRDKIQSKPWRWYQKRKPIMTKYDGSMSVDNSMAWCRLPFSCYFSVQCMTLSRKKLLFNVNELIDAMME